MRVTQRICSPTGVSLAERRVVPSVFLYFHTIIMEGREKLPDKKRSTKRSETGGRSSGKVCLSLLEGPLVAL